VGRGGMQMSLRIGPRSGEASDAVSCSRLREHSGVGRLQTGYCPSRATCRASAPRSLPHRLSTLATRLVLPPGASQGMGNPSGAAAWPHERVCRSDSQPEGKMILFIEGCGNVRGSAEGYAARRGSEQEVHQP
jgi:hypothetical protein